MANDKIPFGGRDWNHDGKYDNFDRMTDFYVYKKVTEDWEKNGAWDKKKKAKPTKQYTEVDPEAARILNLIGAVVVFGLMIFEFCQGGKLFGFILLGVFIYMLYAIFTGNNK